MKLEAILNKEPRMVRRIRAICDRMPLGEVVSSKDLRRQLGVTSIRDHMGLPALAKYRFMVARTAWWGSEATVKQARRMQK